ncbi:hypothetical protein [Sulfobacillus harzensis]|uniref:Uncharacterized protein n=1 Tax=Sulfobacillus harzensis TaxID=2729629 RepID=A0A7Y0Q227_9FIRM|nr:hypothetical protein [Sulfobacillus harzensis]NMP21935.1 hypothetical protein [Sulfobacillus harzensis]
MKRHVFRLTFAAATMALAGLAMATGASDAATLPASTSQPTASSSTWILYHKHQAMIERHESLAHGQSPLPADEPDKSGLP